jgi:Uma2 family endonuclease
MPSITPTPSDIARGSHPDEPLYEVVDGRRVELPPMGAYPTEIASILMRTIGSFASRRELGKVVVEMLFLIDPPTELQRRPDVAFISSARWPRRRPAPQSAAWDVVPDLAIEVVSPSDRAEELLAKTLEFFQAGVRAVWIVYPVQRIVHVYESFTSIRVLTRSDELLGGEILPGFVLHLDQLFQDEPEAAAE